MSGRRPDPDGSAHRPAGFFGGLGLAQRSAGRVRTRLLRPVRRPDGPGSHGATEQLSHHCSGGDEERRRRRLLTQTGHRPTLGSAGEVARVIAVGALLGDLAVLVLGDELDRE
jgi:hypothetical protein